MPSSAGLEGNHISDGNEYSYLNWQVATQEVDNNRSLITWQAGWHFTTYSCRGLRLGQAIINGVTVYQDFDGGDGVHNYNGGHDHRPALETASGSLWIGHSTDGTMNLSAYVQMTGFSGYLSEGWGEWTLPTIPRFTPPPAAPTISNVKQTTLTVSFTDGVGGAPITSRQVIRATNPFQSGAVTVGTSNVVNDTGLTPGVTYYYWAGTYNAAGFSGWSPVASVETITGARVNVGGVWKKATPYVKVAGTWKMARPWTKVMGVWKEDI